MRNVRLGITIVALSLVALLILDFVPGTWISDESFVDGIISYVVLGSIFYKSVHVLAFKSLQYFRLPRLHLKTVLALTLASMFAIRQIANSDNVALQPWVATRGIVFLFAIGFGEEMVSRAFTFGALQKFGQGRAIVISSFLFGLMHLNLYLGSNWDLWVAYGHVMSAFGFGIFICSLMIVTRSIWVAVLFHALFDWGVVFDKASSHANNGLKWNPGFWKGISSPLIDLAIMIVASLLLLWLNSGSIPAWLHRLAVRWKLVEVELCA